MKKFTGTTLFRSLIVVLVLAGLAFAQGTPFGNGRGAFRGQVYVPSVFGITFGDNTASDVTLTKNGSNVVGITGNIGGSGSTANTTAAPAGPFAWGTAGSSSSTVTVTFAKPFTNAPVCYAADQTTANAVKVTSNATTVTIANSGATDTDTVAWFCLGNPN